jgi:hypothetical protein
MTNFADPSADGWKGLHTQAWFPRGRGCGQSQRQVPGNAVNRSFNALARGQFLQACPEILVGCADDLIASEVRMIASCSRRRMTLIV